MATLRREIEDPLRPEPRHEIDHRLDIRQIDRVDPDGLANLLQTPEIAVGTNEGVYLFSPVQQRADEVRAEEASRARD